MPIVAGLTPPDTPSTSSDRSSPSSIGESFVCEKQTSSAEELITKNVKTKSSANKSQQKKSVKRKLDNQISFATDSAVESTAALNQNLKKYSKILL